MDKTDSPRLWLKPREASHLIGGLGYRTILRLAKKGAIPSKSYFAGRRKMYLISSTWVVSNSQGGKVA